MGDSLRNLKLLIQLIEEKLKWGPGERWSGQEFEALREEIYSRTGKIISVTTLKRIWGKAKQDNNPSRTTLNILAEYQGYNNWNHFVRVKGKVERPISPLLQYFFWMVAGISLFFLVLYFFWQYRIEQGILQVKADQSIQFYAQAPKEATFPKTIQLNYHIGDWDPAEFVILEDHKIATPTTLLEPSGSVATTFYLPGYYISSLLYKGEVIRSQTTRIPTDGWIGGINKADQRFPVYLPQTVLQTAPVLTVDSSHFSHSNTGKNYMNVWLYNLSPTATIDVDDFQFHCEVQLQQAFKSSPCKVITISLFGAQNPLRFGYSIPGCIGDLNFDLAGQSLRGTTTDLSKFGRLTTVEFEVKASLQNKQLKIWTNDTLSLETRVENPLGNIGGIGFNFDGIGVVKFANIKDNAQYIDFIQIK